MRLKSLITTICIGVFFNLNAQISNVNDATGNPIRVGSYDKIEGSPYINDGNWSDGIIITQTDKFLTNVKIRYNAFEDELQYLNKGEPFYYANQDLKSFEFSLADKLGNVERFYFENGFEYPGEINKKNFVRVLYNGKKVKILEKITAVKQKMTPASYGESDYDKFILISDQYVWRDGKLSELKLKKGKILKEFASVKDQVSSYFKENTLDLSNPKDVKDLFSYIDELLQ
ncbi:hypothetical protein [Ekhidna sp.]|uniref:hypothetical protein n=1 Tax=Ekhidna sp. TaxID=2608089 RepID=UPI003299117E